MAIAGSQRSYERKAYNADVEFAINIHTYFAEVENISLGGAFIAMNTIPRIEDGDDVSVTIPFAFQDKKVRLKAQVMRYDEKGLGISFF